jgi:hypothetical protein
MRHWERWRTPVLLVLGALLSGVTLLREIGPHDEGLMLQAAQRIADGQLPYRDFWWNYGPGQPLLLALPIKLFGPSLLWWRLLRVVVDAVVALLAYKLIRRIATPGPADVPGESPSAARRGWWAAGPHIEAVALLGWLAAAAAMAWPATPSPNPTALLLVLWALLLARDHRLWAGALCGLAIVFRPEIGVAGAIAVALAGGGWAALWPAAAVAVAGLLPFFVAAPGDMWDDTVGFLGVQDLQRLPLRVNPSGIGFDPNKLLELWMPLILVVATGLWALWAAWRRPRWALPALPLLAVGLVYLLGRPDEFHLIPLAALLAIALAAAAATEPRKAPQIALIVAVALIVLHGLERRWGQLVHPPALADVPAPVADGVQTTADDARDLRALLRAIDSVTCPGDPILVAPPRFDQVSVGDPLLYVLADRTNPTRYDVMQPGIVTTAKVQREMRADLERTKPAVVVRWEDPRAKAQEPNGSARPSGVTLLDDYIAAHYVDERAFGPYRLLLRRPDPDAVGEPGIMFYRRC